MKSIIRTSLFFSSLLLFEKADEETDPGMDEVATTATGGTTTPAEPPGSAGAMPDDILIELVGQDYGMVGGKRSSSLWFPK